MIGGSTRAEQACGFSPAVATAIVSAVMVANGIVGEKFSPAPTHPEIRRWYKRLEKPGFTPPGPVFALAWTAIELGLSYGGYRLLRHRPTPQRNTALTLWGFNMAMIGGWSVLFFGSKDGGKYDRLNGDDRHGGRIRGGGGEGRSRGGGDRGSVHWLALFCNRPGRRGLAP